MYQKPHIRSKDSISKPYCFLKLPIGVDPAPILDELQSAEISWLSSQWKWHIRTHFLVLRAGQSNNYPGSELVSGKGVDQPVLTKLPLIKHFLNSEFPVRAEVAWIGLSPQQSWIYMHIDNTKHWDEHHRIHIPLETNTSARLCVANKFLHLPLGTVWAINNSIPHAAINTGPARLHLILDLPSTPAVEQLLSLGQRFEGEEDPKALSVVQRDPSEALSDREVHDPTLMARFSLQ